MGRGVQMNVGFKTGHFALHREQNTIEFLEGPFRNQLKAFLIY